MSDDLLITPGSRKLEIKDSSGNVDAKIETDASGNLLITNAGGDISIGDTSSDVFIGDGTNNVDIVFEQDGEIRGTSGVTLTLGASGSSVAMATDLSLGGNDITNVGDLTITGNLTITGDINSYNVTDLDVTDKTITLGVGQTEANSGDSGIIIAGSNASMLWNESNDRWTFNKGISTSGPISSSATSGSSFYAASFTRSSSGLVTPDIWGGSGTLVLGTSSSDERLALSTDGALIYGRALVRNASSDQNTNQDSASIPDTTGPEIMRFEGSYTNGTYTTEFAKVDRSGNLPLYVRQSKGTANSFSNIARFGDHGQSNGSDVFAVFGGARVGGRVTADNLTLNSISTQSSETTVLTINGSNVVGKRDLGSNAFNSTAYLPLAGGTMTGTLTGVQITATTTADATPAIIATNTGGINGVIQRWVGESDSMELRNFDTGDYSLMNAQQDNGIVFRDGSGGVEIHYNGAEVLEVGSSGGLVLHSGALQIPNNLQHKDDSDTYIKFDADRVRIVNGNNTYLDTNNGSSVFTSSGGTVTGNISISKDNPVLILNETSSTSNTDQLAYISFQDNGTEEAWVGWGSNGNTNFTINNSIGSIVLNGSTSINGTLTMGANNISMTNSNISGVNALTINDPGEGIIFTGTNNVSLYAVDDANDNIMKFDGAAKLLVNNDRVLVSSERDLATNSTGTTSTDFVTVYTVNGNNLASHVRLSVTGTTGNVVVSCVADILCNHSGDIFISSMSGNYTQMDIKVTSNGNEDFAIECKRTDSQTTQATLRYSLVALSQDTTITQSSSHSYSTTTLTHRTKAGSYQSATDGADHGYFNNMRVGAYIYHDGDTDTSIKFDTNRIRFYAGGTVKLDTNNTYLTSHQDISGKLDKSGGTMTGTITSRDVLVQSGYHLRRSNHHSGHLEGSYNNVAANADKTNPIYSIGSSYNPNEDTLGNFYGIGFSKNTASFMTGALDAGDNNGWGLYVAADGDARIFLNASDGIINSTGEHYVNSQRVFHDGYHPNADKWTTARTLTLTGDATGSGNWDGSSNLTITTVVGDDSHNHHRLDSTDDRDMKPSTSGIAGSVQAIKPFFSSYGGMTGTDNTTYVDVLAFDTYSDSSGGGPSAITFKKGNSAGNPEMHIWHASWNATTWSTGQRVFADNYHPNADKWTTARTITLGGDLSGNVSIDGSANVTLTATVANDSHTHAFNNLTAKTSGTGTYSTSGYFQAGRGSGGVALTHNDGYGNANVTFNHVDGIPEQGNNCGRIVVNTDGTTAAKMTFELLSNTGTSAVNTPSAMELTESGMYIPNYLYHLGDTDTYLKFDANRIRLYAGGAVKFDSNNTYLTSTGNTTGTAGGLSGTPNITVGTINSGAIDATISGEEVIRVNTTGNTAAIHWRDSDVIRGLMGFSNGSSIYAGADDHDMVIRSESKLHLVSNTNNLGITLNSGNATFGGQITATKIHAGGDSTSYNDGNDPDISTDDIYATVKVVSPKIVWLNDASGDDNYVTCNDNNNTYTVKGQQSGAWWEWYGDKTLGHGGHRFDYWKGNGAELTGFIQFTGTGTGVNDGGYIYFGNSTTYKINPNQQSTFAPGSTTSSTTRKGIKFIHGMGPEPVIWYHATAVGAGMLKIYTSQSGVGDIFALDATDGDGHFKGDVTAFSTTTTSDIKLKENVRDLEGALDTTLKLRGVKFDWKDENKANNQLGFIAQEVEEVLPEIVKEVTSLGDNDETHKSVNYSAVVPVLVEAIKELKQEIDDLKEQLKNKEL